MYTLMCEDFRMHRQSACTSHTWKWFDFKFQVKGVMAKFSRLWGVTVAIMTLLLIWMPCWKSKNPPDHGNFTFVPKSTTDWHNKTKTHCGSCLCQGKYIIAKFWNKFFILSLVWGSTFKRSMKRKSEVQLRQTQFQTQSPEFVLI